MCQFRAVLVKGKPRETAVVLVAQSRITMETVGYNEMEKTIISWYFFLYYFQCLIFYFTCLSDFFLFSIFHHLRMLNTKVVGIK